MRVCHRVAILRRQVKRLAAIAAERVAQAEGIRAVPSFRRLTAAETKAFLGCELLAKLADVHRS